MRRLGVRRDARFNLVKLKEDYGLRKQKMKLIKEMDALLAGTSE
ncbi:hypothetical protein [Infirmifilum sp. NZ]|nr:hypothetical protein [Infirmifilum sp. NZ]